MEAEPSPQPAALDALRGETMGTRWSVKLAQDKPREALRRGIQRELDAVVGQMSPWKADSDLGRYNRAPASTWHTLPAEFAIVLEAALALARDSDGAYDPTVGPLVDLWGFGPAPRRGAAPSAETIAAARARVGWRRLRFDAANRRLQQPGGLQLDLCAIAKGRGVDRVAGWLHANGVADCLIEVGGELRACGTRPDGAPWRVGVERPAVGGAPLQTIVALRDLSIATSGDRWNAFDDGGLRYAHTIDPRTGRPAAHRLASVTVLARECMRADALATALGVLGPDTGLAWAQARGIAALFVLRGAPGLEERMTAAFAAALAQ